MNGPERDDLDRLLAKTATAAPRELSTRVLKRVRVERRSLGLLLALALDALALAALVVIAVALGRAVAAGEARELLLLTVQERDLVLEQRADYARALADALPWRHILTLTIDLLAIVLLTRYLLRATDLPETAGKGPR